MAMHAETKAPLICVEDLTPTARDVPHAAENRLCMDEASFRSFYDQSAARLFGYLLRVSGERALAQDLLQETYVRFLTAKLPPLTDVQARNYLFRIATNLMRDQWRCHREDPLPDKTDKPAKAPPMDRQLEMRQAFQRLKLRERQLLWLAYVEGATHKEIAECTGLRSGSVRLLLFRARRRLARLIREGAPFKTEISK
jgi:RNA polymerase sigma-70 factor, ECF subfamily